MLEINRVKCTHSFVFFIHVRLGFMTVKFDGHVFQISFTFVTICHLVISHVFQISFTFKVLFHLLTVKFDVFGGKMIISATQVFLRKI